MAQVMIFLMLDHSPFLAPCDLPADYQTEERTQTSSLNLA